MNKVIYFIFAIYLYLLTRGSSVAYAKEESVNVNLPETYDVCTFDVNWTGDYTDVEVLVESPDGETYKEFTVYNDYTSICVRDAASGEWTVTATGNNVQSVTADVHGSSMEESNLSEPLTVGRTISGLCFYMVDNNLEVSWTDATVGRVNITITNTANMQILYNETVEENHAEYDLTSIDEVMITIVPAASVNVDGATSQYIVNTHFEPKAEVSFMGYDVTNQETASITVHLEDSYYVIVRDSEGNEEKSDILPAGYYHFTPNLYVGEGVVTVYIEDISGNRKSYTRTYIVDRTPPQLFIQGDVDGTQTYDNSVTITGNVCDYSVLVVNGWGIPVSENGNFEYTYDLLPGENKISMSACDQAGNRAEYEAIVTQLMVEEKDYSWLAVGLILVVLAVVVGIIAILIKKGKIKPFRASKKNTKDDDTEKKETKKKLTMTDDFKAVIKALIITPVVFTILLKYIICIGQVPSCSMAPTINAGDRTVVNRLSYVFHEPERGDIVVFYNEEKGTDMLKRIVGLPGERIYFRDGNVYINDVLLVEEYIQEGVETNPMLFDMVFEIPEDCYFMLGDNRFNSADSRLWINPYIPKENIVGKVILVH